MIPTMIITSKYSGACNACGRAYQPGDRISWDRTVRGASHAVCTAEGKALASKVEESRAVDADIAIPCPDGRDFYGYQKAGIAYALQRRGTLIADEMGVGKTAQAIGVINATPAIRTVLVVCPASLKLNWRNEFRMWGTREMAMCVMPHTGRHIEGVSGKNAVSVTIINYDILKKLPEDANYDLLILDEAHYAKNPKAQRTKAIQAIARRCRKVLALTGTPILNKPIELWPLLQMVDPLGWDAAGMVKGKVVGPGEGAGFFRFAKRYCNAHQEQVTRNKVVWIFDGSSNLDELNEKLRATCMVRRLKSEVLAFLPPKMRRIIPIGNGCDDEDDYGDMGDDYETMSERVKSIPFEKMSRVRHEQALKKVEPAIAHVRDAVEASGKVIVFAHHLDVIAQMGEALADLGVVTLVGDTTTESRQAAVERFQSDPSVRVFLGGLKAAGVGLTLTASSHVVFVERDWTPATCTQAEDRAHRIGQTAERLLIDVLVLEGSLDAKMAQFIKEKQDIADLALDADTLPNPEGPIVETADEKRARKLKEASLTEGEVARVHTSLKFLAARCDGAAREDGVGFNKLDTNFGRSLAMQNSISVGQAVAAKKMLGKYRHQLEGMKLEGVTEEVTS